MSKRKKRKKVKAGLPTEVWMVGAFFIAMIVLLVYSATERTPSASIRSGHGPASGATPVSPSARSVLQRMFLQARAAEMPPQLPPPSSEDLEEAVSLARETAWALLNGDEAILECNLPASLMERIRPLLDELSRLCPGDIAEKDLAITSTELADDCFRVGVRTNAVLPTIHLEMQWTDEGFRISRISLEHERNR